MAKTNINTDADDCSLEVEETVTWHPCVSTAQTFLTQRQRQYEKKITFNNADLTIILSSLGRAFQI